MSNYLGMFDCKYDVFSHFEVKTEDREGIEILLATYGDFGYDGYAYVLFKKDGVLYDVEGSHCSCHGLEGQWEPTETNYLVLKNRVENGSYDEDKDMDKKVKEIISSIIFDMTVEKELSEQ